MIRLIALDLDGTLLDPAGQITDETKAAIAQARQAGIKVVLSTGRSVQEAADFSAQAGCDNLSVCLGGAVLSGYRNRRPPAALGYSGGRQPKGPGALSESGH